jgi:hypothetical protein
VSLIVSYEIPFVRSSSAALISGNPDEALAYKLVCGMEHAVEFRQVEPPPRCGAA